MIYPHRLYPPIYFKAVVVPLESRIVFKSFSGEKLEADMIGYLLDMDGEAFEDMKDAFDHIPVGVESEVQIKAVYCDMLIGIQPGWRIEGVWAL